MSAWWRSRRRLRWEQLNALQRRVGRLLTDGGVPYGGSGTLVTNWAVGLDVNAADGRLESVLAPVAGERICLNDTGVPAPEGPQRQGRRRVAPAR